jgi:hypothetical protein
VPFLPDLSHKPPGNSAAYKGFYDPVHQRSLYLAGLKYWQEQGFTEEQFREHIRVAREKAEGEALRRQGR